MRLPEETEERGMGVPVIYTIMAVSVFVLIVLGIVWVSNRESGSTHKTVKEAQGPSPKPTEEVVFADGQEDIETLYREHKLRAEDLDFWNMYEKEEVPAKKETMVSPSPSPDTSSEPADPETDGRHISVLNQNGEEEWVEISDKIAANTYDLMKIKIVNGQMAYYQDGEKASFLGVDLSKSNGTVDFEVVKAEGIDFVMLKLGGRGYESGLITLDDNFPKNMAKAAEAGLEVGVYFFSQAITVEEAEKEADFVIENLVPYQKQMTYPVVFDMEYVANAEARIELTDEKTKTEIADAFLTKIADAGYQPMIYGNKNWLLTAILPEELLDEYPVWLSDQSPVPDYPYDFKLWKYAAGETIPGVEGTVDYTISFVDYTGR